MYLFQSMMLAATVQMVVVALSVCRGEMAERAHALTVYLLVRTTKHVTMVLLFLYLS